MVARFFQEVKEVLARNVFKKQKKVGGSFEGTVEGDNVRVRRQRLMDRCLSITVRVRQRRRRK